MSNYQYLKSCIEACNACSSECEHCATECLKEDDIKMLSLCISLTRECALLCDATARLLSMGGEHARILCHLCSLLCEECASECERNANMEHCRRCAMECRRCAYECKAMMEEHVI
jgi:hypothetical protein